MGVQTRIHGKKLLRISVLGQQKNLIVLRECERRGLFEAHPLVEDFNRQHGTNLTVVSHKVADAALTVAKEGIRSFFGYFFLPTTFPVGASIAYEKPGTKLGKEIVLSVGDEPRVVLATGKYKGEKDIALVALDLALEDFKRERGKGIVLDIPESRLVVVPNFPSRDGWYMPHAVTGVPQGRKKYDSDTRYLYRYLYRLEDSSYVGLPVRGSGILDMQTVFANLRASSSFMLGVVAEVPEADVTKIEALLSSAR
jgi:hypothetical protein